MPVSSEGPGEPESARPGPALPQRIRIVEVGPRDGFQMETTFLPTELKVRAIERLATSGFTDVEAVSFVHPRVIPQMRDADDVMRTLERRPGVRYHALVPNRRGAERALAAEVDALHVVVAVTETYNQRNVGMSVAESMAQLDAIARGAGDVPVTVTLAVAFGCPFEGQPPLERILRLADQAAGSGVQELGLADTAGLGHPLLVRRIVGGVQAARSDLPLRLHLHDTRGLGIANALTAVEMGVTTFDSSLGGLGGCPVMKGASGNIATEDLVNLCNEIGIDTGVDLDVVREVSRNIERFLGRSLPSHVLQSGTRDELLRNHRD